MKKYFTFFVFVLLFGHSAKSQIICIFCYTQNDSISQPVTNLIANGGFENGNCAPYPSSDRFCPNSSGYNCDITNWTCTGGGTSTYACILDNSISIIPQGVKAAYLGNSFCRPCSTTPDDTSCLSQVVGCEIAGLPVGYPDNDPAYGGNVGVSIEQTVSSLTVGNVYVLEFWSGGELGFMNDGLFAVDVGFGNSILSCRPTAGSSSDLGITYIIEFRATATSHTIKFTNWGHICSSCTEVVLDNVRLYPVTQLASSVPVCDSTFVIVPIPETLFIPNVFTPNNDNTNNFFEIIYTGTESYLLQIYNRWGQPVFESNDKNVMWDGKINGKEAVAGTYYYVLTIGAKNYPGFLTLLR